MSHRPALTGAALSAAAALTLSACIVAPVTAPPPVTPPPAPAPAPAPAASLTVVAAGSASQPPSLTAVTQGQVVRLDTVQPLHPSATPRFNGLNLSSAGNAPADTLLGWNRATGQVVATPAPPATAPAATLTTRVVQTINQLRVADGDQLLAVLVGGSLNLPALAAGGEGARDGRVLVIKALTNDLRVLGIEGSGRITLTRGQTLTLAAATRLDPPQWLVIGKN
jgi:hypothetical protein